MRALCVLGLVFGACSSDTSNNGDAGIDAAAVGDMANPCPGGGKMCGGTCTPADPAHGCGGASCTACGGGANGAAACISGACGLQCNVGFGDCDGNTSNGCEKDVTADPANCGSCGFACPGGASCVNGACQLVTPGMGSDNACLTIDANTIYWTTANANPGAVYSIAKSGGAVTQIITGQASPRGIAVDSTSVYFTLLGGGSIYKCPLAGCNGTPTTLATGQSNPFGLTVDATNVYWTNRGNGTVYKCAIGGCSMTPTMLGQNQMTPSEIAVDSTNVYWTNQGDGSVWKSPIAGGGASMVTTTSMAGAHGIVTDGTNIYFTQATTGDVNVVGVGGGTATPVASGQNHPWGLAMDTAGTLVWSNSQSAINNGAVIRMNAGGSPVTRAAMQQFPLCVAVDATTIYWIDAMGNSIQKVAR
jgi:hypothetical protein